jgi:hypothetical protein
MYVEAKAFPRIWREIYGERGDTVGSWWMGVSLFYSVLHLFLLWIVPLSVKAIFSLQRTRVSSWHLPKGNWLQVIMPGNCQPQVHVEEANGGPIEVGPDGVKSSEKEGHGGGKKKIVIVGLGMVGISFMW